MDYKITRCDGHITGVDYKTTICDGHVTGVDYKTKPDLMVMLLVWTIRYQI